MNRKLPPPEVCAEMEQRGIPVHDASAAIKMIAKGITSNEHFVGFLLTIAIDRRKEAYDAVSPHLGFKVWSFRMLMLKKETVAKKMKQRLGFDPRQLRG